MTIIAFIIRIHESIRVRIRVNVRVRVRVRVRLRVRDILRNVEGRKVVGRLCDVRGGRFKWEVGEKI